MDLRRGLNTPLYLTCRIFSMIYLLFFTNCYLEVSPATLQKLVEQQTKSHEAIQVSNDIRSVCCLFV